MDIQASIQVTIDAIAKKRAALVELHPAHGLSDKAILQFEKAANSEDIISPNRAGFDELLAAGLLDPPIPGTSQRHLTDLAIEHFHGWLKAWRTHKEESETVLEYRRQQVAEAILEKVRGS